MVAMAWQCASCCEGGSLAVARPLSSNSARSGRSKPAIGDLSLSTWVGFELAAGDARRDNGFNALIDLVGAGRRTTAIIGRWRRMQSCMTTDRRRIPTIIGATKR